VDTDLGLHAPSSGPNIGSNVGVAVAAFLALIGIVGVGLFVFGGEESVEEEVAEAEFYIVPAGNLTPDHVVGEETNSDDAASQTAVAQNNVAVGAASGGATPSRLVPVGDPGVTNGRPAPDQAQLAPSAGSSREASLDVVPTFGATALSDPGLIQEMIRRVIGRYKGQVKHCYDQQLKNDETLRGTWYLAFTIRPNGKAANVRAIASTRSHAALESCMVRKAQDWKFQPLVSAQYIEYPFVLR
jgi:outer membrane biosynthesis protein TonB